MSKDYFSVIKNGKLECAICNGVATLKFNRFFGNQKGIPILYCTHHGKTVARLFKIFYNESHPVADNTDNLNCSM